MIDTVDLIAKSPTLESTLLSNVVSVKDFLANKKLSIPIYQRPYKWNKKHVTQLVSDIKTFRNKPSYRFGTVVIHVNKDLDSLDIVDGQQRTITMLLLLKALVKVFADDNGNMMQRELSEVNKSLVDFNFANPISQQNIHHNYKELLRLVADFDEETTLFLLHRCEFVVFKLTDISEAFQFFDSQNARGKDLAPHDLLKAFHLRAFDTSDETKKLTIVDNWENTEDKVLVQLFGEYLFRVKGWAKGQSARYFTKDDTELFKGIDINKLNNYPYSKSLRILHHYIDEYNSSYYSRVNQHQIDYPFQINEAIINGRRFFEMIAHYRLIFENSVREIKENPKLNDISKHIIEVINNYEGRYRTGDRYARMLFDTSLIYYIDKFGQEAINTAIQFFFIWSYNVRLDYQSLQLSSIDNYVLQHNLFKRINDSFTPKQVFEVPLKITNKNLKSDKTKEIRNLFITLNYLQDEQG